MSCGVTLDHSCGCVSRNRRTFHRGQPRSAASPLPARPSGELRIPNGLDQAQASHPPACARWDGQGEAESQKEGKQKKHRKINSGQGGN